MDVGARNLSSHLRVPLKGYCKRTIRVPLKGSIEGLGLRVSENWGYFGVLVIRILLCRALYLFSETPTCYSSLKASLTSWLGNRDLDTEVETVRHYKAGDGHARGNLRLPALCE